MAGRRNLLPENDEQSQASILNKSVSWRCYGAEIGRCDDIHFHIQWKDFLFESDTGNILLCLIIHFPRGPSQYFLKIMKINSYQDVLS